MKHLHHIVFTLVAFLALTLPACASPRGGDVDLTFDPGTTINGRGRAMALQPDGKVVLSQDLYGLGPLMRLNTDGTFDPTFTNSPLNGWVYSMVVQPDGKLLVGGDFTAGQSGLDFVTRNGIARLNADGSLDASFQNGMSGALDSDNYHNGTVSSIALQADGRIVIGGGFSYINGVSRKNIARLNADGSLDNTFQNGMSGIYSTTISYATTARVLLQADGKVFVSGFFDVVNGVARHNVARLNSDGSLDTSFPDISSLMGFGGATGPIVIQPDGKLLIPQNGELARFNADGSREASFTNRLSSGGVVYSIALQADGKIIEAGLFNTVNGVSRISIARLNANGSPDTTFQNGMPGVGFSGQIFSTIVQSDGKVLIAGDFNVVNGVLQKGAARLKSDGSFDNAFHLGRPGIASVVYSVATQPDGKVIIGGASDLFWGGYCHGIARFNADGSLDATFQNGLSGVSYGSVHSVALQPDGKILMGGSFDSVNGIARNGIARLNSDGSSDSTFQNGMNGISYSDYVYSVVPQADGKVLIGGHFTSVNGVPRSGIARLNTDGSLDADFQNGMAGVENVVGGYPTVFSLALQSDGKVLLGGRFNSVNGTGRTNIARLNPDGSLDDGFQNEMAGAVDLSGIAYPSISSVMVQPDGKVLIGGTFDSVNGMRRNGIARLNTDGSLDSGFQNEITGSFLYPGLASIFSITLQPNGKVLIGGQIDSVNGTPRNGIARLNPDGSLDTSFQDGMAGPGGEVDSIALLTDGKVFIGGYFVTVNGMLISELARLYGTIPSLEDSTVVSSQFGFNITGYPSQVAVVEASTNLLNWIPLQTNTLGASPLLFSDPTSATFPRRFYRARLQ